MGCWTQRASIASTVADLSIRNIDDGVRDRLRLRAARNGRSMEAEAREILSAAVEPAANWLMDLRESCAAVGGVDLDLPRRAEAARSAEFAP